MASATSKAIDEFEDDFRKVGPDATADFAPAGSPSNPTEHASSENLQVAGKTDDAGLDLEDDEDEEDEEDDEDEDDLEEDDEEEEAVTADDLEEDDEDEDDDEDDDEEDLEGDEDEEVPVKKSSS